jgi:hypothetical protein
MSAWRKSSYSSGNGDNCVEVAASGAVLVRDTMNRDGATLALTPAGWKEFLGTLR